MSLEGTLPPEKDTSPTLLSNAWEPSNIEDGVVTYRLKSWVDFFNFIEGRIFDVPQGHGSSYIWRGQRRADWSVSTTLDRLFGRLGLLAEAPEQLERKAQEHLEAFKYAARGRRGSNPAKLDENEWWALGQHFGLATPLLDWTRSPFAAAYFAFESLSDESVEHRAIYALDRRLVDLKGYELNHGPSFEIGRLPIVEFVDPLSDENQRLVSQGGLFTRAPIGMPMERWVARTFEGSKNPVLMRIEIPNADRLKCLRALDRMNINHTSLFPDLMGASRATNLKLESISL